jgi:hypothetical protein
MIRRADNHDRPSPLRRSSRASKRRTHARAVTSSRGSNLAGGHPVTAGQGREQALLVWPCAARVRERCPVARPRRFADARDDPLGDELVLAARELLTVDLGPQAFAPLRPVVRARARVRRSRRRGPVTATQRSDRPVHAIARPIPQPRRARPAGLRRSPRRCGNRRRPGSGATNGVIGRSAVDAALRHSREPSTTAWAGRLHAL